MSDPTVSSYWNQTTPAPPSGDQACVIQTDNAIPQDSRTVYPQRMVGDSGSGGKAGTVPPPAAGDGAAMKWLKATGAWLAIVASDLAGAVFGASGASHSVGAVPDPGSSAGTTRFLREDATWVAPAGSSLTLKHDGTLNGSQTLLNLKSSSSVEVRDDGSGGISFAVSTPIPAFVQHVQAGTNPLADGAFTQTALVSGVTPGNALVVTAISNGVFSNGLGVSSGSCTDDKGDTPQNLHLCAAGDPQINVWIIPNCVGGNTTVTITGTAASAGFINLSITEWSNVATASVVDGSGFFQDNRHSEVDSSWTFGPLTTTNANDLLITHVFGSGFGGGITAPSGFSTVVPGTASITSSTNFLVYFAESVSAAGTFSPVVGFPGGGGNYYCGFTIALKTLAASGFVLSYNGRSGIVTPQTGDYSFSQLSGTAAATQLPAMVGDTGSGGTKGAVPAPAAGDAAAGKYLKADGTFAVPPGTGGATVMGASGASHAAGLAPDPGATAGSTKFLREDATWAVPAGGGGSVPTAISSQPDWPPASPTTYDDEFTGASLAAGWTWLNQGAATATLGNNSWLALTVPANASGTVNLRGIYETLPASPWQFDAKLSLIGVIGTFIETGIMLRQSSTGKVIIFGPGYRGSQEIDVTYWTSATAFSSVAFSGYVQSFAPMYFRVKDDGTNLIFSFSRDGVGWLAVFTASRTAFFSGSADGIGIGAYTEGVGGAGIQTISCDFIRRTL